MIGVGGAGGNAVNNMIRSHLEGVEFVVANTDAQAIAQSTADRRIQLGVTVTQGLGAGSRPDIGRIAAEEALEEIIDELRGSNMVFIAAGMGGGTGTGAAPVIARAAREAGILTVGVVTKPFHFEGAHRMRLAEQGIEELEQFVDTLIIIPNQNLFRVANERTTFADAFKMADDVLHSGVRGVTDLMVMPGLINLDFADIRAVMSEMGKAMMGTGEAEGDRRALDAAEAAISNPLLDDVSMKGARGVLINITGGPDMTLFEVDEAANRVRSEVDPDAFIIFGSTFDESLQGKIRVSVVATGMDSAAARVAPTKLSLVQNEDDATPSFGGIEDEIDEEAAAALLGTGTDGAPYALGGDGHGNGQSAHGDGRSRQGEAGGSDFARPRRGSAWRRCLRRRARRARRDGADDEPARPGHRRRPHRRPPGSGRRWRTRRRHAAGGRADAEAAALRQCQPGGAVAAVEAGGRVARYPGVSPPAGQLKRRLT